MLDLAHWDRHPLRHGGERLQLRDGRGFVVGTAVRLPGTLWRIYLPSGEMIDRRTEREVIALLEARAGLR